MQKLFTFLSIAFSVSALAQSPDTEVKLSDLAVPTSPAFIITDISPSMIQSPTTPKAFVLGIMQSYQQSGTGFPQNYSAEFTPYWWLRPEDRSVYSLLGFKTKTRGGAATIGDEDPKSGLKFTSISLAFINKDMMPDTVDSNHKIISVGIRTTILKFHQKNYITDIAAKIDEWHTIAQLEMAAIQEEMTRADSARSIQLQTELANYKPKGTAEKLKEINELMAQKPIFSWDIAAAYSSYGVNDSTWESGRTGAWSAMSLYLPIDLGGQRPHKNYFNLNAVGRYLLDNYYKNSSDMIVKTNTLDLGGKIGLEFDNLSVGVEFLHRFVDGEKTKQKRTVGIINYRIADNIFLNGAFGENFDFPNKLVALFGINWGIGSESIKLP